MDAPTISIIVLQAVLLIERFFDRFKHIKCCGGAEIEFKDNTVIAPPTSPINSPTLTVNNKDK